MPYSTVQLLISWFSSVCGCTDLGSVSGTHLGAAQGAELWRPVSMAEVQKNIATAAHIPHRVLVNLTASPRRDWPFIVHYITLSNFIFFNEEHTGKQAGRLQVDPISICCSAVSFSFHVETPVPSGLVRFQILKPEVLPDEI